MVEVILNEKRCTGCQQTKPLREYHCYRAGYRSQCKDCRRSYIQDYRARQKATALKLSPTDIHRFWAKVEIRGSKECWPWKAGCKSTGYGTFTVRGRNLRAHRVAWWIAHGEWPPVVHHKICDSPPCCNDAHLDAGSQQANIRDMVSKGRHNTSIRARGETQGSAKLTEADVRDILARYPHESQSALAREKGVSQTSVWRVIRRRNWTHVDM